MTATEHPAVEPEGLMSISARIAASETTSGRERFSPTRWPYTYAYDFMRTHGRHFGGLDVGSRQAASDMLECICATTGEDESEAQIALAYAYCREQGIVVPDYPFLAPDATASGSGNV